MRTFIIFIAVVILTKVQTAPINSKLTTQNTTSYSTANITGLLATAQLHINTLYTQSNQLKIWRDRW